MFKTRNIFRNASRGQPINHNENRSLLVYDEDIFGDAAEAESEVARKIVTPPTNRRAEKRITHVGPLPPKRYVRQQPLHPYQRPNQNMTNGIAVNGTQSSGTENEYKLVKKIGSGTYGEVFKGFHTATSQPVAIKRLLCKIRSEQQWQTASREIDNLRLLKQCKSVVQLLDYRKSKVSLQQYQLSLVFEMCPFELKRIISNRSIRFTLPDIKALLFQLFEGLTFIHHKKILHRDIKTENILLTAEGQLKIADFGLSRAIIEKLDKREYTVTVVTLWYRAPELLFGDTSYSTAIDLWSAGCVMAEFWTRTPIMQGSTEREQIDMISRMCGSINRTAWPDVEKLQLFRTVRLNPGYTCKTREFLLKKSGNEDASELFKSLLTLDPKKRVSAFIAQNHDFFWMDPLPSDLKNFMANVRNNNCEF